VTSGLLADLTPLRVSVPYRRMWLGASLSSVGAQLTTVAVGLQVYDLTRSTFSVGLVGLFALVPLVVMGLYGGSVIDAYDRRTVIIVSSAGLFAMAAAFVVQAALNADDVGLLYGLVAVQSACYAVNSPARTAIIPRLLSRDLLPSANALSGLSMSVGMTIGPALGGVLVASSGFVAAYSVEAVFLVVALASLVALPRLPPEGEARRSGLLSVLEGLSFLRSRPNVRMTFAVDICAMVLAMPRVLFPAIGATLLGGGATTVGVLVAAIAAGSVLAGVFSGRLGGVRWQGRAVIVSVVGWGLAITVFGLIIAAAPNRGPGAGASWWLAPAIAALAIAGACDAVSAVFRSTILQAATPDALRGRLQGIFIIVVAGGPRLGDLLLGAVSELSGEALAAIGGGLACVAIVLLLAVLQAGFSRYDARDPQP
jgi:ENTS family enterobactin (siderophore) exporter